MGYSEIMAAQTRRFECHNPLSIRWKKKKKKKKKTLADDVYNMD